MSNFTPKIWPKNNVKYITDSRDIPHFSEIRAIWSSLARDIKSTKTNKNI